MNINKLIEQLCPDGVEYKRLDDFSMQINGMTGVSQKWEETGNCQFIEYLNAYNNLKIDVSKLPYATVKNIEKQTVLKQGDILFTSASETPDECAISSVIEDSLQEGILLDDHLFGIRIKKEYKHLINPVYLNYYFRSPGFRTIVNKTVRGVTRFYISKKDFMEITIPLPPLQVQKEIVTILDNFTNLAAELQAELQLRKKQYEYYRTRLLSFDKNNSATNANVEYKKLEEVFELRNGYTPSKNNPSFWEGGTIPWYRMEDIREQGRILSDSKQHITAAAIKGKGLFKKNSFILATTATIGEHALLIADSLANQQFTNLKVRKSLEDKFLIKFIYYYMFVVDEYCKNHTNKSGFESVDMDALKAMPIPIPPLAEQQRIVDILDKFDALVNDLSQGLPAEINLVQKQYEYYRNLFLTF